MSTENSVSETLSEKESCQRGLFEREWGIFCFVFVVGLLVPGEGWIMGKSTALFLKKAVQVFKCLQML